MHASWTVDMVTALYGLTGAIRIFSYICQFHAVRRDTQGAQSTSLLTWSGFFAVWLIGAAYGWIVIDDMPVVGVSLCGAIGSGFVLGIAALRRYQFHAAQRTPATDTASATSPAASTPAFDDSRSIATPA